ncbi:uncharacterized protein PV07_07442 [Cladophialophora immunda]|uniref:Uncharacterized protein n=1 Tax=Cladophialophora immunda TaxID=569365 RepID=A0A0D2ARJ3_9EURO|nr:uncharacterized protein PV07_07442 [Cladophialophora immunda]KIW27732.1 hypothetical protein PV07_07442 [Cladophialophora immunda]OQV10040.1 hypothetical protein CLAIMM_14093 isoform 1 [Cladophialophora immunda]OQV10041.1 hypothetical protein CLAIMM_14093 isoform 2 [Cladophialophora immunda]
MPLIEQRSPGQDSVYPAVVESTTAQSQWISDTSTTEQEWATSTPEQEWSTSTPEGWATSYTTQTGWITSYTTTTDCDCDWEYSTTSSSWCPTPIIVTPTTTSLVPFQTTSPAGVIVVDHHNHGLAPGVVGGIVLGVFFGVLLLVLLCICCFRNYYRGRRYYAGSSSSSSSSHSRHRKPPVVVMDPYPNRRDANLTFVGGGNYPGTRVMVTKSQKIFIRPPPVRQVRTVRETRRSHKVVVVEDDD